MDEREGNRGKWGNARGTNKPRIAGENGWLCTARPQLLVLCWSRLLAALGRPLVLSLAVMLNSHCVSCQERESQSLSFSDSSALPTLPYEYTCTNYCLADITMPSERIPTLGICAMLQ